MSGYRVAVADHGFPDLLAEASALREVGAELSVHQYRAVLEVADAALEAVRGLQGQPLKQVVDRKWLS